MGYPSFEWNKHFFPLESSIFFLEVSSQDALSRRTNRTNFFFSICFPLLEELTIETYFHYISPITVCISLPPIICTVRSFTSTLYKNVHRLLIHTLPVHFTSSDLFECFVFSVWHRTTSVFLFYFYGKHIFEIEIWFLAFE